MTGIVKMCYILAMVKISVIIPISNSEKYLRQSLESVLAQTLSDIEVICVDNASEDNSLDILKEYAVNDKRIKIIEYKKPHGIVDAKNKALKSAKGEYITFVCPKDYIDSFMLERMYKQAQDLNSEIVVCDIVNFNEKTNRIEEVPTFERAISYCKEEEVKIEPFENIKKSVIEDTLLVSPSCCSGKIFSKSLIKGIDFSKNKLFADTLFICKTYTTAENISYINWPFYVKRTGLTDKKDEIQNVHRYILKSYNENKKYLKQIGLERRLRANLTYHVISTALETALDEEDFELLTKSFKRYLPSAIYRIFEKCIYSTSPNFFKDLFGQKHDKNVEVSKLFINKTLFSQLNKKHDTYILFDNLIDNETEKLDAYVLYQNLQKNGIRSCYVALKDSNISDISDRNIIWLKNPVSTHPKEFLNIISKQLLRAKGVITSFDGYSYELNEFFRVNPYFEYIYVPSKPVCIKGCLNKEVAEVYKNYNFVLSTSEIETKILQHLKIEEEHIIRAGLPRWDLLNSVSPQDEKSILFMFSGRKLNKLQFNSSYYRTQISELLNNKRLSEYLKEQNVKAYFVPNSEFLPKDGYDFGIKSENVIVGDTKKISEYIKNCSCLVTDYSSVALDFMYQNKPVLYYLFDKDNTQIDDDNDYESFKNIMLFNVFDNEKELVEKIKGYVDKDFKLYPEIISFYGEFFYPRGNYSEQFVDWLRQR